MKKTTIDKLTGIILGAVSSFVLFGGTSEALAADLTASAHNISTTSTITEVDSLMAFNLRSEAANSQEITFTESRSQSNSGINKWVGSIYYLMMMHLILSFILSSQGEKA